MTESRASGQILGPHELIDLDTVRNIIVLNKEAKGRIQQDRKDFGSEIEKGFKVKSDPEMQAEISRLREALNLNPSRTAEIIPQETPKK